MAIVKFPINPSDGMMFEPVPGVIYKYNSRDRSWYRIDTTVAGLATPNLAGLMSKEDYAKLQSIILPPPQSTLQGEDCDISFNSGVVALYSTDGSVLIDDKLSVGKQSEPWKIHENTAGYNFQLNLDQFIEEIEKRGKIKKIQLMGKDGKKGAKGDPGIDNLETGPIGLDGEAGANSPFPGTFLPEAASLEIDDDQLDRAIVDITTEQVSETENYIVVTRANIGNPDACPASIAPSGFDSPWVLVLDQKESNVTRRLETTGDCAITCRICVSQVYYINIDTIIKASEDRYIVKLYELKYDKERLVGHWLKVMSSLFNEQKYALCCALENCISRKRNQDTRRYIEQSRIAAAQANQSLIISTDAADKQITRSDQQCPVDTPFDGGDDARVVYGQECDQYLVTMSLDSRIHTKDPRINANGRWLEARLPPGDYMIEVLECCAAFSRLPPSMPNRTPPPPPQVSNVDNRKKEIDITDIAKQMANEATPYQKYAKYKAASDFANSAARSDLTDKTKLTIHYQMPEEKTGTPLSLTPAPFAKNPGWVGPDGEYDTAAFTKEFNRRVEDRISQVYGRPQADPVFQDGFARPGGGIQAGARTPYTIVWRGDKQYAVLNGPSSSTSASPGRKLSVKGKRCTIELTGQVGNQPGDIPSEGYPGYIDEDCKIVGGPNNGLSVSGCDICQSDDPAVAFFLRNARYSGRVALLCTSDTPAPGGQSVLNEQLAEIPAVGPSNGYFTDLFSAKQAYIGLSTLFRHAGGNIKVWIVDPDANADSQYAHARKANDGTIVVGIRSRRCVEVSESAGTTGTTGVPLIYVYRDKLDPSTIVGTIQPYVGDLTHLQNYNLNAVSSTEPSNELTAGPVLEPEISKIFFVMATDGMAFYHLHHNKSTGFNTTVFSKYKVAGNFADVDATISESNSTLSSSNEYDGQIFNATWTFADEPAGIILNNLESDTQSDWVLTIEESDFGLMKKLYAVGVNEELLLSQGAANTPIPSLSIAEPFILCRALTRGCNVPVRFAKRYSLGVINRIKGVNFRICRVLEEFTLDSYIRKPFTYAPDPYPCGSSFCDVKLQVISGSDGQVIPLNSGDEDLQTIDGSKVNMAFLIDSTSSMAHEYLYLSEKIDDLANYIKQSGVRQLAMSLVTFGVDAAIGGEPPEGSMEKPQPPVIGGPVLRQDFTTDISAVVSALNLSAPAISGMTPASSSAPERFALVPTMIQTLSYDLVNGECDPIEYYAPPKLPGQSISAVTIDVNYTPSVHTWTGIDGQVFTSRNDPENYNGLNPPVVPVTYPNSSTYPITFDDDKIYFKKTYSGTLRFELSSEGRSSRDGVFSLRLDRKSVDFNTVDGSSATYTVVRKEGQQISNVRVLSVKDSRGNIAPESVVTNTGETITVAGGYSGTFEFALTDYAPGVTGVSAGLYSLEWAVDNLAWQEDAVKIIVFITDKDSAPVEGVTTSTVKAALARRKIILNAIIKFQGPEDRPFETMSCDSWDFAYTECQLPKRIGEVWVMNRRSRSTCVFQEGESLERNGNFSFRGTFGITSDGKLWVDHGCRATFGVRYEDDLISATNVVTTYGIPNDYNNPAAGGNGLAYDSGGVMFSIDDLRLANIEDESLTRRQGEAGISVDISAPLNVGAVESLYNWDVQPFRAIRIGTGSKNGSNPSNRIGGRGPYEDGRGPVQYKPGSLPGFPFPDSYTNDEIESIRSSGWHTIAGTFTGPAPDNVPIKGGLVHLKSELTGDKIIASTITDDNGRYVFSLPVSFFPRRNVRFTAILEMYIVRTTNIDASLTPNGGYWSLIAPKDQTKGSNDSARAQMLAIMGPDGEEEGFLAEIPYTAPSNQVIPPTDDRFSYKRGFKSVRGLSIPPYSAFELQNNDSVYFGINHPANKISTVGKVDTFTRVQPGSVRIKHVTKQVVSGGEVKVTHTPVFAIDIGFEDDVDRDYNDLVITAQIPISTDVGCLSTDLLGNPIPGPVPVITEVQQPFTVENLFNIYYGPGTSYLRAEADGYVQGSKGSGVTYVNTASLTSDQASELASKVKACGAKFLEVFAAQKLKEIQQFAPILDATCANTVAGGPSPVYNTVSGIPMTQATLDGTIEAVFATINAVPGTAIKAILYDKFGRGVVLKAISTYPTQIWENRSWRMADVDRFINYDSQTLNLNAAITNDAPQRPNYNINETWSTSYWGPLGAIPANQPGTYDYNFRTLDINEAINVGDPRAQSFAGRMELLASNFSIKLSDLNAVAFEFVNPDTGTIAYFADVKIEVKRARPDGTFELVMVDVANFEPFGETVDKPGEIPLVVFARTVETGEGIAEGGQKATATLTLFENPADGNRITVGGTIGTDFYPGAYASAILQLADSPSPTIVDGCSIQVGQLYSKVYFRNTITPYTESFETRYDLAISLGYGPNATPPTAVVKIGANDSETLDNLQKLINNTGTNGVEYFDPYIDSTGWSQFTDSVEGMRGNVKATVKTDRSLAIQSRLVGVVGNGFAAHINLETTDPLTGLPAYPIAGATFGSSGRLITVNNSINISGYLTAMNGGLEPLNNQPTGTSQTITFKDVLVTDVQAEGYPGHQVKIGATPAETIINLCNFINGQGTQDDAWHNTILAVNPGAPSTWDIVSNITCSTTTSGTGTSGDSLTFESVYAGIAGNAFTSRIDLDLNESMSFAGYTTFVGGTDPIIGPILRTVYDTTEEDLSAYLENFWTIARPDTVEDPNMCARWKELCPDCVVTKCDRTDLDLALRQEIECITKTPEMTVPLTKFIFSPIAPCLTCQMHWKQVEWYERGWRIGACCGAYVEVNGVQWLVVKRSIGTDMSCGGGESENTECIKLFTEAGKGHPAIAWPTADGEEFLGRPHSGFVRFTQDPETQQAILTALQQREYKELRGNLTPTNISEKIPLILFPASTFE